MANTYPRTPSATTQYISAYMADVSAPSKAYICPGFRGKIKNVRTVLGGAITGADSIVTVKINTTAVTGGTITITQSGSAAGDIDTCTPTGLNTFTATDYIAFDTDGASSTTQPLFIVAEIEAV